MKYKRLRVTGESYGGYKHFFRSFFFIFSLALTAAFWAGAAFGIFLLARFAVLRF